MAAKPKRPTPGIEVRHARDCPAGERVGGAAAGACKCTPSYRAWAYDRRANDGKGGKVRKTFATASAAKQWRADAIGDVRRGRLRAVPTPTLREAAEAWLAGAEDGSIRNRSGDRYKPSAIRGYRIALENRLLDDLGARRLSDITRVELQDLADRLLAGGLDPSTIRNQLMPLRAIYRRAIARGEVAINPTTGLELPAVRGRRDRIASPPEARELLAALKKDDRALWATAMYAGLRRGELMALRVENIDLAAGVIRIDRAWDPQAARAIEPKSAAGRRSVPVAAVLRDYLDEHLLGLGRREGLAFGRSATTPFADSAVQQRARRSWANENERRQEAAEKAAEDLQRVKLLEPIGMHECRHTFASLLIAARVNAKAGAAYMGHASVSIFIDRYGHLMEGHEGEATALLDAYLQRADTAARVAQLA